jgi:hypothetical protein
MLESLENRVLLSGETGLRADYFNASTDLFNAQNASVGALPAVTETDQTVNFNWGASAPVSGVNSSAFEVRWSGQVLSTTAGSYTFSVQTNAAVRLFINNQLLINDWTPQSSASNYVSTPITLAANTMYNIRLDIYQPNAAADNSVSLEWQAPGSSTPQVIPAANLFPFMQATSITSGGLYVGSWYDTNPNDVVVEDSTTAPVTIADSTIEGSGTLISDTLAGVNLTVQDSYGYGLNPNQAGVEKGSFLYLMSPSNVDIQHNSIIGVGGLGTKIYGFDATGSGTIKIDYNDILNSDGRFSDGDGGYEDSGVMTHSIQLANIYNLAGIDIGWNEIINQPGQSYVNDVINLFDTSGTQGSPVNVHDNYIDGLYSLDTATTWDSGSGITTDGDPNLATEPAYINIHNNTIIQAGSAGIGVPDGHDISVYDNYLVCCGYLPDGTEFYASGTGIYINDLNGGNSSIYYNNGAYDNTVGWIQPPDSQQNGGNTSVQSDYSLPDADPSLTYGNVDLAGPITTATENAASAAWISQLGATGLTVGAILPTATSGSSGSGSGGTPVITPAPTGSTGSGSSSSASGSSGSSSSGSGSSTSGSSGSSSSGSSSTGSSSSGSSSAGSSSSGSSSSGSGSSSSGSTLAGSGSTSSGTSSSGSGSTGSSSGSSTNSDPTPSPRRWRTRRSASYAAASTAVTASTLEPTSFVYLYNTTDHHHHWKRILAA